MLLHRPTCLRTTCFLMLMYSLYYVKQNPMIQSVFGKNKSEHFVMMIHYRTNFGNCTIFFQLDVQYHVLFGNYCLTKKMLKPNLIYLKYNLTLFRTKYRKTNNDNIYQCMCCYVYSYKIFQVCFAFAQITHLTCGFFKIWFADLPWFSPLIL